MQDGKKGGIADMKDELVQRCVAKIHVIRITVSLMHQDLGQRD